MSKGHLPGAHPARSADEKAAPLTQHHATSTGQSRGAVTSWQSRGRRGLAALAVGDGGRRSAVTGTMPQPVHAPSRDSLHAKGEARLARMPLRSHCPARHGRRHGKSRLPEQIGGYRTPARWPTVTLRHGVRRLRSACASIFSANCRRRHLGDKLFEKAKFMMRTYNYQGPWNPARPARQPGSQA